MSVAWSYNLFKADAEKVYSDIEKIAEKTPQNLVDYAQAHPKSELHKCFTWDDAKAANEYRKTEARQVLRLLVFVDEKEEEPTKIRVLQKTSESYEPVKKILRDEDEYKALLARAKAELQAFKRRYENLVELEEVLAAIDKL